MPTDLVAEDVRDEEADLSWTATRDIGRTRVEVREDDSGDWSINTAVAFDEESATVTGLLNGQLYGVRLVEEVVDVETGSVEDLESESATINGDLIEFSGVPEADCGVEYRQTGNSSWVLADQTRLSSAGSFDIPLSGLSPDTEYEARARGDAVGFPNSNTGTPVTFTTTIPGSAVSRWAFEQNVTDSWGSNDGTDNTSAGYSTTAQVGSYSKIFDGNDDSVSLPNLGLGSAESFSITAWVRPASIGDAQTIFGRYDGAADLLNFYIQSDGTIRLNAGHAGGDQITVQGDTTLSTDTWYHVGVTFDNTAPTANLYLDGGLVDNQTSAVDDFADSTGPEIGARSGILNFDGLIDDVRLYDKPLSSTEVSNLYNTDSIQ